ncbi:tetratricopeptide repeat protein [Paraliomyxa miuraensis]|uniref:tetratricopeptide repeat protein n=1 Tax=Paraliomyxa miuraensis TaxID=376150 RepID=UPI002258B6A1|nr:tetratricopeptide repeat protein [Paraliomyxa miuraensis]MCX4246988.1 tetratricopeptide repeat protein [Paraliomyxa miuraensis]
MIRRSARRAVGDDSVCDPVVASEENSVQFPEMNRGRGDRPGFPGLRLATGSGDLIEDIHRQQRRRTLKRAAQVTALATAIVLLGVAAKIVHDRHERATDLEEAYVHYAIGTPAELEQAITSLQASIDDLSAEHTPTLVARALALAHRFSELGEGEDAARRAVAELAGNPPGAALARGLLQLADGELDASAQSLEDDRAADGDQEVGPFVIAERAWLGAMLVVARQPDDADARQAAVAELQGRLAEAPEQVALRRVLARLLLLGGDAEAALHELEEAQKGPGRYHVALSADWALYDAYWHASEADELRKVASVADQLLQGTGITLSPPDRAHAQLARAVVHVQSGEVEEGLALLDEAWAGLPSWDRLSRRLAIRSALEAGDASRTAKWVEAVALPEAEADIYRAWAVLVEGDVMDALGRLAKLPQDDPWVGYLQALALVDQGRYVEAKDWIDHTERKLPGRVELEVARARVELRTGDKKVALRKLEALAQEEARAPRAWTGLGEAHALQDEPDWAEARKALRRAVEREPHPAEATLLLAQIADRKRGKDPKAETDALALYEQAAEANRHLPRYREALAIYLDDIGFPKRAREQLQAVVDEPGVGWEVVTRLVRLEAEANAKDRDGEFDPEPLLAKAVERGAPPNEVVRLRARIDIDSDDKERLVEAQEALAVVLAQDPQDVDARVMYAQTFSKQFDRKAAEAALRKGLSVLTDDSKDGRLLWAWAEIESRAGKSRLAAPRARRAFVRMLAEGRPPSELLDVADLAMRVWLRLGKERTALSIASQLTDRLGYHSQAWTLRARTELGAGEAASARQSAEQAIALDDDNPRAHEINGHALLRYGLKDKAREEYERALELVKGTPLESEYKVNLKRL